MSCKCDTINIVNDNNVIVVSHADGRDGKSAYQQAVEGGYTGTEQEFNCSLSLLADVADGKKQIAYAINTKGGNASADSSFSQLAKDIQTLPYAGISAEGIVQDNPFTLVNALFSSFSKITEIYVEDVLTIASMLDARNFTGGVYALFPNLRSITLKKTKYFAMNRSMIPACTNFILPSTTSYYESIFNNAINVEVGTLTESINPFYTTNNKLRNFTIGQDTDVNLRLFYWAAANVIAEGQSGINELNNNLYNNLLSKLYDHSEDGETRILQIGWLEHVTQENIDYANSKGWTLTT